MQEHSRASLTLGTRRRQIVEMRVQETRRVDVLEGRRRPEAPSPGWTSDAGIVPMWEAVT